MANRILNKHQLRTEDTHARLLQAAEDALPAKWSAYTAVNALWDAPPLIGDRFAVVGAGIGGLRELVYGLEGAHSRKRILHVGDATGQAIMEALLRRVAEQPNIRKVVEKPLSPETLKRLIAELLQPGGPA